MIIYLLFPTLLFFQAPQLTDSNMNDVEYEFGKINVPKGRTGRPSSNSYRR